MIDPTRLLGGMLAGGFRRRPRRGGMMRTAGTALGAAAVGGLGYMAYRHFQQRNAGPHGPGQAQQGWGAPMGQQGFGPQAGQQAAQQGWGAPMGQQGFGPQGPQAGPQGWGAPMGQQGFGPQGPQTGPAPGFGAAAGAAGAGILGGMVGARGGLQQGFGAGMPGYEHQSGAMGAGPAPAAPPFAAPAPPSAVPPYPPGSGPTSATPTAADAAPPAWGASGPPWAPAATPAVAAPSPPNAPDGVPTPEAEAPTERMQRDAMLLVRAMIAAANADGVIDAEERSAIVERATEAGLSGEELDALVAEIDRPRPVTALIAEVDSLDLAEQFYAVSLLASGGEHPAERAHLAALPTMLELPPERVAEVQRRLSAAEASEPGAPA